MLIMGFAALKTNLLQLKHCLLYLPIESTNKRDGKFEPQMRSLITANINDFFPHLYFKYRTGNTPRVLSMLYKHERDTLVDSLAFLL